MALLIVGGCDDTPPGEALPRDGAVARLDRGADPPDVAEAGLSSDAGGTADTSALADAARPMDAAVDRGVGIDQGAGIDQGVGIDRGVGVDQGAEIDQGVDAASECAPGAQRPCLDPTCRDGHQLCLAGRWQPCVGPAEICDGADNDCDGEIDEALGLGEPCQVGVGGCRAAGQLACDGAGGIHCDAAAAPPAPERCDGVDNDCDGVIDEGLDLGGPCTAGVGACVRPGRRVCDRGGAVVCDAVPAAPEVELCDGADNNCDGQIDEGFRVGVPCGAGIGACRREGLMGCDPGGGAACSAEPGGPAVERCDGVDNDCDGAVDEGFEVGAPCTIGVGACEAMGTQICAPDGGLVCDAPVIEPGLEGCDGIDNDCDGEIDEGFAVGTPCVDGIGACANEGRVACEVGGGARCDVRAGEATPERCDGVDNDCDGQIDEGYALGALCNVGLGACLRQGTFVCAPGGGSACSQPAGEPRPERCDGLDNDCDGMIDEEFQLGAPCAVGLGECVRPGEHVCDGLGGRRCSAAPGEPTFERCDGLDNDCDGEVDEGFDLGSPCAVGVGGCAGLGIYECGPNGGVRCGAVAGEPAPELCDGVDNDCDGQVDEGFGAGAPCSAGVGGCARVGVEQCNAAGDGVECGARAGQPVAEHCDGIDNDCDGRIDEGACGRRRVAVIGLNAIFDRLLAAGFTTTHLAWNVNLPGRIDRSRYDVVWIGRYASNWARMTPEVMAALTDFSDRGGSIVAVWDGLSIFGSAYHPTFRFLAGAPPPLGWFPISAGGGVNLARNTPVDVVEVSDPIFAGLGTPYSGGRATESFFTVNATGDPTYLQVLATFRGDGTADFPAGDLPAVLRGRRCGGHVLLVTHNLQSQPDEPRLGDLVANLTNAALAPPANVVDVCDGLPTVRPRVMRCGTSERDVTTFFPKGVSLSLEVGCTPGADTQALLISRDGRSQVDFNADSLRAFLSGGGVALTEFSAGQPIYNAALNANEPVGARRGGCRDNVNPLFRENLGDPFWRDNFLHPVQVNNTGCGYTINFPGVVRLGGWAADQPGLGYVGVGQGRLWLVEADWQDVDGIPPGSRMNDASRALMGYMITQGAGW